MYRSVAIIATLLATSAFALQPLGFSVAVEGPSAKVDFCKVSGAAKYSSFFKVDSFSFTGKIAPGAKVIANIKLTAEQTFYVGKAIARTYKGSSTTVIHKYELPAGKTFKSGYTNTLHLPLVVPEETGAFRAEVEFTDKSGKAFMCGQVDYQS